MFALLVVIPIVVPARLDIIIRHEAALFARATNETRLDLVEADW
jgi:hypothetical protein